MRCLMKLDLGWMKSEQGRTEGGGGRRTAALPPPPFANRKFKKHGFCRHDNFKRFTRFALQQKLATGFS